MSSLQSQSWHRLLFSAYSSPERTHLASATGPNGTPLFFGLFKEQTKTFFYAWLAVPCTRSGHHKQVRNRKDSLWYEQEGGM